ncbi:MAG: gp436 family protein [Shimia sp.]
MAYATQSQIEELYGRNALVVADHDRDGVPDAAAITRALDHASDEIDTYVGARYPTPLEVPGPFIAQLCVDIALYRMALSRDVATTEHRTRYEDAIAHLKAIASGKASLARRSADEGAAGDETAVSDGPRPILQEGPERLFTRDTMEDL